MSAGGEPGHVGDELAALLAGECDRAAAQEVVAHLRGCPACTDELVSLVMGAGALRYLERAERALSTPAPTSGEPRPIPDFDSESPDRSSGGDNFVAELLRRQDGRRNHKWRQRAVAMAGAVALVVVGGLAGARISANGNPAHGVVTLEARLERLQAPPGAHGRVEVEAAGGARQLVVYTIRLPAAPPGHFYEVWLLDPATLKMLPMGVLGPSGRGDYQVASAIMSGYSAVDISLQANDGNPAHSKTSVLRAYL
jgi:hypothetical protein